MTIIYHLDLSDIVGVMADTGGRLSQIFVYMPKLFVEEKHV